MDTLGQAVLSFSRDVTLSSEVKMSFIESFFSILSFIRSAFYQRFYYIHRCMVLYVTEVLYVETKQQHRVWRGTWVCSCFLLWA